MRIIKKTSIFLLILILISLIVVCANAQKIDIKNPGPTTADIKTIPAITDHRVFPRWQEEAIIMDVLHGDRCDSIKNLQAKLIESLNEQLYVKGSEYVKLENINNLLKSDNQMYALTVANNNTQIAYWKREDKKHKRQRNLVVAAVVVVEVLKFVFTGKAF